ncbi:MAG: hypothetical protein ACI39R_00540 [Lachnospiraceae bacterium]
MRKMLGFILLWIAVGMILMLLIRNILLGLFVIALCLILGYNLFCKP